MAVVLPEQRPELQANSFDETIYHSLVLQLPVGITEDEFDERLGREAQDFGVLAPGLDNCDGIASSVSATTIASDHFNHGSIMSQSTAPTSCSSSERRPPLNHVSIIFEPSPPPSMNLVAEKKGENGFRRRIRKVTGFGRRRSLAISSSTLSSINSNSDKANFDHDHTSGKSGNKTPASAKSRRSSWSQPVSPPKSSYGHHDEEPSKSSLECKEIQMLRRQQVEERTRFLSYQTAILSQLRSEHEITKSQRQVSHKDMIERQTTKVDGLAPKYQQC